MIIAYAQVNLLCSCQSSIAVLIVGRRKLTLPQIGIAFSVFSIFSYFDDDDDRLTPYSRYSGRYSMSQYYMAVSHKDWELPNSRI